MRDNLRPFGTPATVISLAVIVTFALFGATAVGGDGAHASQVNCGETITADTTLDSDLVSCPNNGIVIGADDITLNLNGHLVDGDGTPAVDCDLRREVCDAGVVNDGHDGVTVMRGSVQEFAVGVLFGTTTPRRARHNRVLSVSASRNQFLGLGSFPRSEVSSETVREIARLTATGTGWRWAIRITSGS